MDGLIRHCLREIAFDGDLGCDASRLAHFIDEYYGDSTNADATPQQVDDSFRTFVWSLIAQEPSVILGTVPPGSPPVWIAPQLSAIKKGKGKADVNAAAQLEPLDPTELENNDLSVLITQYGDRLRIAVDHETSFTAITGSHLRSSKLGPMTYTVLQFITRSRTQGISMKGLGDATGYDQKTIHYLAGQLLELDLILKLRISGISKHACIHKYFYPKSAFFKAEAGGATTKPQQKTEGDADDREEVSPEDEAISKTSMFANDLLDPRLLAQDALIKGRIITLLKGQPNHLYQAENFILAIGVASPTRTDKRFFAHRMRGYVQEGWIEKVQAPTTDDPTRNMICFHLVDADHPTEDPALVPVAEAEDEQPEIEEIESLPVANVTLQRQMLQLIHDSGKNGITLNEIAKRLGNMERRVIEQLLTRCEREAVPPGLADFTLIQMLETVKREHRHKYYTLKHYRDLMAELGDTVEPLPEEVGTWSSTLAPSAFYRSPAELSKHLQAASDDRIVVEGKKVPKKHFKNPIGADGRVLKGRPRNEWSGGVSKKPSTVGQPKKKAESVAPSRKRGRPPKRKVDEAGLDALDAAGPSEVQAVPPKKPRGRPRKSVQPPASEAAQDPEPVPVAPEPAMNGGATVDQSGVQIQPVTEAVPSGPSAEEAEPAPTKRPRGRPRKSVQPAADERPMPSVQPIPGPSSAVPPSLLITLPKEPADSAPPPAPEAEMVPEAPVAQMAPVPYEIPVFELPSLSRTPAELTPGAGATAPTDLVPMDVVLVAATNVLTAPPTGPTAATQRPTRALSEAEEERPTKRARVASDDLQSVTPHPEVEAEAEAKPTLSHAPRGLGVNVTYKLRQKEFMHLLTDTGGIAIADTFFLRQHSDLIKEWHAQGLQTSAPPGTVCDKKTLETLLRTLEDNKLAKVKKTVIGDAGFTRRQSTIFYLPNVTEEAVQAFVEGAVNRAARKGFKIQYKAFDGAVQTQQGLRGAGADKIPIADAELVNRVPLEVRRELLKDHQTSSQLFGFIAGRMARARELHLYTLSQILDPSLSTPYVILKSDYVIDVRFLWTELPIETYCSLIPVLEYSEELEEFLASEERRKQRVKDMPTALSNAIGVGRARSRVKIVDILHLLFQLGLITPLRETAAPNPYLTYPDAESSEARGLEVVSLSASEEKQFAEVKYWQWNLVAPLYGFNSPFDQPPLLSHLPVAAVEESLEYWDALQKASLESFKGLDDEHIQDPELFPGTRDFVTTIRRRFAWSTEYRLSGRQMSYLSRFVDYSKRTTPTPVDANDPDDPFNVLCYAVAAPPQAVSSYYADIQKSLLYEARKEAKQQREAAKAAEQAQNEAKKLLGRKFQEEKERLQKEWDRAVAAVHPEPLSEQQAVLPSLERVCKSFFAAGGLLDTEKLNAAIKNAMVPSSVAVTSKLKLPLSRPKKTIRPQPKPVEVAQPRDTSDSIVKHIMNLVNKQQPKLVETQKERRERRATQPGAPSKRSQRFVWTPEFDELGQDATAVLAARSRACGIMSWAAAHQVLPGVGSEGLRNRMIRQREDPVFETYMLRLEEAWYNLWVEKRGTEELPDPEPDIVANVDLVAHIAYLRKHLDKGQIRSGVTAKRPEVVEPDLPKSVALTMSWLETPEEPQEPRWDFVFNVFGDEHRERGFYKEPLTDGYQRFGDDYDLEDADAIAEAAIKMTLETPEDQFDPDIAAEILNACGEEHITAGFLHLEKANCITRVVSDPDKRAPGRQWRFQDWQEDVMSGPINSKLYKGAQMFEQDLSTDEDHDLPYVINDGTMVALLSLVSEDKVMIHVDTSHPASVKDELEGNSKKVVDDQLETSISIRLRPELSDNDGEGSSAASRAEDVASPSGNLRQDPVDAAQHEPYCARTAASGALIACRACIEEAKTTLLNTMGEDRTGLTAELLQGVSDAESAGIRKPLLEVNSKTYDLISGLTAHAKFPLGYWVGYGETAPALVGAQFLRQWALTVPSKDGSSASMVMPRRWTNVRGARIDRVWYNALRHVAGWVWNRPGLPLAELRYRLCRLFNRMEVLELVEFLRSSGLLKVSWNSDVVNYTADGARTLLSLDDVECTGVYLHVKSEIAGENPWYRLTV